MFVKVFDKVCPVEFEAISLFSFLYNLFFLSFWMSIETDAIFNCPYTLFFLSPRWKSKKRDKNKENDLYCRLKSKRRTEKFGNEKGTKRSH